MIYNQNEKNFAALAGSNLARLAKQLEQDGQQLVVNLITHKGGTVMGHFSVVSPNGDRTPIRENVETGGEVYAFINEDSDLDSAKKEARRRGLTDEHIIIQSGYDRDEALAEIFEKMNAGDTLIISSLTDFMDDDDPESMREVLDELIEHEINIYACDAKWFDADDWIKIFEFMERVQEIQEDYE